MHPILVAVALATTLTLDGHAQSATDTAPRDPATPTRPQDARGRCAIEDRCNGAPSAACASGSAAPYRLSSDDFDRIRGTYVLPDGTRLSIAGTRGHPVAELDAIGDGEAVPLRARAPTTLVAGDRCLILDFRMHRNGQVSEVAMTYLPARSPSR